MTELRRCASCAETKPEDAFYRIARARPVGAGRAGRDPTCKRCRIEQAMARERARRAWWAARRAA